LLFNEPVAPVGIRSSVSSIGTECACSASGVLSLYQTLLAKLDPFGEINLPLTRTDWYAEGAAGVRCNSEQAKAFPAR
jgi:hypothetical protein